MLLKDYRVLRPTTTKIQAQKGVKYVYQVTDKTYHSDKKFVTEKRTCIGRMIDDEYMMPNDSFADFYPDILMSEKEAPTFSDTLKVGTSILIEKIMKDLQLDALINSVFEEEANIVKDIITYMIIEESSTFQYFPDFMYDHPSFEGKIRSDSFISKMLKHDIGEEKIDLFMKGWNSLNANIKDVYISYDSTNMNTCAVGIELAEFSHAKDDESKPQVNLSYVINQTDSTPLHYELYDGSVVDNSQCNYMVEKMKDYGYKNIGFILDRGYFSKKNIDKIRENGYELIMMVKDNTIAVQESIHEIGMKLRLNNSYYLYDHKIYGSTVRKRLFEKDKKEVYVHLYYDNIRAEETRNDWLESLHKTEERLIKKVNKKVAKVEEVAMFEKFFKLKFDDYGYLQGYERNEKKIQEETNKFGYFAIITTKEMTAQEALGIYRDRDSVEKMFRSIKTGMDYDKFGIHSDSSLLAKTHLVFIASIVRNVMGRNLRELVKKDKKHYTIPASIRELEKIEVTKNTKGRYIKKYAPNAKQKAILKAFEIDEITLNKMINKRSLQ